MREKHLHLHTYQHASDFLAKAQPTLEKNEVVNSLLLGICIRLRNFPEQMKTVPYLATVENEHGLVAAACMTPPYRIVLSENTDAVDNDERYELLVQNLWDNHWSVPGVLGPAQNAEAFASSWRRRTGQHYQDGIRERVFALSQVIPPQPAPGVLRLAMENDLDLVTRWLIAFQHEALHKDDRAEAQNTARTRIGNGSIYVWALPDGNVVSMAGKTRPVSHVISVGPVYTPPGYRGKGYASNCVAALSTLLLESGWQQCSLFTDLANPISNSIYQKIGYRPVCDFNKYLFAEKQSRC